MTRGASSATVAFVVLALLVENGTAAESRIAADAPLFAYLTGPHTPRMVAYSPSELDPRVDANHERLATTSLQHDLKVLRAAFDGLVLYGYHPSCTPRILSTAQNLGYHAVLLGIWEPKSRMELDGVAGLVCEFHERLALGVIVGNEGLASGRYAPDDLASAAATLRSQIPQTVPLSTSEPLTVSIRSGFLRYFGDFLAPNIHPALEEPGLTAEQAAAWTRQQAAKLARLTNKPVVVKETGFPHGGAEGFTPETQRRFWAAYVEPGLLTYFPNGSRPWVFHGVAFEAFDLPWKAAASGQFMERSWGLFSPDRRAYPAFAVWRDCVSRSGSSQLGK